MSSSSPTVSTPMAGRPQSVRSVASTSSIASGVSLTRRARTRTRSRSRTVTGSATRPSDLPPSPSDIPFPADPSASESESIPQVLDTLLLPPKSIHAGTSSSKSLTSQEADSANGEVTLVAGIPQPSPMPPKLTKAAKQASQLASIETSYPPALSAFSRDPELTPNARDSFSTQKSSTSSSFYPPSTSTISGPESPASPQTAAEELHQQPNISLLTEADIEEMQDYDGDDVAYRLRLLVNNSYFLPPAHMKPSAEDFAASMHAKKPPKPSTANFLDIFRVGKTKSKPPTPVAPTFGNGPMLRTTSDSIAAPFALRNQPRSPQTPHNPTHPMNGNVDRGRVVVVRERVNDIAVAAKQAEHETKTRNARREHGSDRARQQPQPLALRQAQEFDDVIDPTDAVDIPLPASNYPFAVQASALHGLGVQDSVGAAILADRLPPNSPGMSTVGETDDHWRKALLQQAVHHSLDNTPDDSMFSYVPGTSTPMLATPRVNGELSRSTTPGTRAKRLQQRIAEPQTSLEVEEPSAEITSAQKNPVHQSEQSQASTSKDANKSLLAPGSNDSRRSSFLPARAITPIANLTPLTPAPRTARKQTFNATYSTSHSDSGHHHSIDSELHSSISPKSRLRRSMSTPLLSESFESMRQQFVMTPPPLNVPATRRSSQLTQLTLQTQSYETTRELPSRASAFSSQSLFDDYDGRIVRGSPRLSALGNRLSYSSYSQESESASPTTSAFQDALNHSGEIDTVSSMHRPSLDDPAEHETRTRSSIASPPPRPSTSIAHHALCPPPPRSSSFNYPLSALGRIPSGSEPRIEISAASPTKEHSHTSPYTSSSRRRDAQTIPLSLEIPSDSAHVAIHSPEPSSPTSFFDTLQTQPNAMDDLDSSDEDSDEDEEATDTITRPPTTSFSAHSSPPAFVIDPRARANSTVSMNPVKPSSMMRLGNFSAPYVGRGQAERSRTLPIGVVDPKKALGFTPAKAQFFSERKSDLGHGGELSTTLIAQAQAQQAQNQNQILGPLEESPEVVSSSAPSPSSVFVAPSNTEMKRRPATANQVNDTAVSSAMPTSPTSPLQQHFTDRRPEALRKFDGMLVQHMEAEKDRIKKIAGAIKSSSQVNLPGSLGGPGSPS
ncbi:hypothetical protein NP233_g3107 [Leucocoprinus birnbaumii]|uniref:Uncharacterized protein n=1 Tax=Leucocoprinus birnbaumii TaxID=56174 RepID=A0AAD5W0X9_9AGAR|nr:hypothetical protein NP233_g3107 [Leucocoprinus birnbaumii]